MGALSQQSLRRIVAGKLLQSPVQESVFILDWLKGLRIADLEVFKRGDRLVSLCNTLQRNKMISAFFGSVASEFDRDFIDRGSDFEDMEDALSSALLSVGADHVLKRSKELAPVLVSIFYSANYFGLEVTSSSSFLYKLEQALTAPKNSSLT